MKSQISPTYNHPVKRKSYLKIRMSSDVVLFHVVILLSQILVTKAVDTGGINTGGGSAYDPWANRNAPDPYADRYGDGGSGQVSPDRLKQIRDHFLYPFFDQGGGGDNIGDYQKDIRDTVPQINKQINFLLPFMGFGFNYTWLSLHGYFTFSNAPQQFPEYPLVFPIENWPRHADPSFIAPFYSRCKIGELNGNEEDEDTKKKPGVYFRLERDLYSRTDTFGVEIRERVKWDIRESMVGTDTFEPKHVIIATWKNVSFAGGIPQARRTTNTFQAVLVTDEVRSYAIFNYEWMGWTSHTEAGGDTTEGQGGTPAFVGFNAGNGTKAYEYKPYSQTTQIRDLPSTGGANGFPGRHIFRIDEKILPGVCIRDLRGSNLPLVFAPENGNMLGGTMVNLTGPCFVPGTRVTCRFNSQDSDGVVIDENRASCIMPTFTEAEGWVDFEVSLNGEAYYWKGMFYVETPSTSPQLVWFKDESYHELTPPSLQLNWDPFNLTMNEAAKVDISLWGYTEDTIEPKLIYISQLERGVTNRGMIDISPSSFDINDDGPEARSCRMGMIMINLTNPMQEVGMSNSPMIWSRPMPLGWYFNGQWQRFMGSNYVEAMCDKFIKDDREWKNFAYELPTCPCLLRQAIVDRGRYAPDFECDQDGNTECFYNKGAQHCVRTGMPNLDGAGQQCCYDLNGYLMMTSDNKWGGKPMRSHNLGVLPWNEAAKIPSLSHWLQDISPFYPCCMWQGEQSGGCQTYRFERRASQDCVGYLPPGGATVFGDPHVYTFDNRAYTFNGVGEYVLVRSNSPKVKIDVQGRFEQVLDSPYGEVHASHLTAVAARDNVSATVEVRVRAPYAQWRYRLDVLVNGRPIYFDRWPQKIQHFQGVTVYTPSNILNQSHVIMMFQSGAGVEVLENKGYMATRVYLPWTFINQTRGLMGTWNFTMDDDFYTPDGNYKDYKYDPTNQDFESYNWKDIYDQFALKWLVHDMETPEVGKSLFHHANGRSANSYHTKDFIPEFQNYPEIPQNVTWVSDELVRDFCGNSYQCKYDYATTLSREFAMFTKYYQDQFINIYEEVLKPEKIVISCGQLPIPANGRKSTFAFTPGTKVQFDCEPGYVLVGERRRWCYETGDWNWPELGDAECIPEAQYNTMQAGITAGIALAVLIPVACVVVCVIQRFTGGEDDDDSQMELRVRQDRM